MTGSRHSSRLLSRASAPGATSSTTAPPTRSVSMRSSEFRSNCKWAPVPVLCLLQAYPVQFCKKIEEVREFTIVP